MLPPDFKDLLEEFGRDAVEFVLVGGYAVAVHGRPRATKDIDLVLEGSKANLARCLDYFSAVITPHAIRPPAFPAGSLW